MDREVQRANTAIAKEEKLRLESFPLHDDNQYYKLLPAGSAHTKVTETDVEHVQY